MGASMVKYMEEVLQYTKTIIFLVNDKKNFMNSMQFYHVLNKFYTISCAINLLAHTTCTIF